MVETDSQSQLPSAPPVPEQGEATTTNPSMNGLEAHFTSGTTVAATSTDPATESTSSSTAAGHDQHSNTQTLEVASSSSSDTDAPKTEPAKVAEGTTGAAPEDVPVVQEKRVGCAHYKRRAKFVTPCCNKLYMCRYCHDEHETHYFNRKTVTQLICTECDTRQRVQAECEKCGVRFGKVSGWSVAGGAGGS